MMRSVILLLALAGCASEQVKMAPEQPLARPASAVAAPHCLRARASSELDAWGFPTVGDLRCRSKHTLQKPKTVTVPELR